jgi:ATP/ADP translocase
MMQTEGQARTRLAGTAVERKGWVLVALLAGVMVIFGLEAYFSSESPDTPIVGSLCCTGQRLSDAPSWVSDYFTELGKYMGTFMVGTGVFGLAVIIGGLRIGRRGAWAVAWYVPLIFAIHGFALGSFPFDIAPLAVSALGQLLMIRPVFGRPAAGATDQSRPVVASSSVPSK